MVAAFKLRKAQQRMNSRSGSSKNCPSTRWRGFGKTKKVTLFAIMAVMAVLMTTSVMAQTPAKPFNMYLGGGGSLPSGDLADGWKMGFHGTCRFGVPLASKMELTIGADFHTFALDMAGIRGIVSIPAGFDVDGGAFTALLLGGDIKLNLGVPNTNMNPYLFGGGGMASLSISDITVTETSTGVSNTAPGPESETKAFFEFGAGVEMGKIFIQGKYVSIQAEGESINYIPFSLGFKF